MSSPDETAGSPSASTGALSGRVALVTGGGRGIGRGVSLAVAAAGATVAVNYRRDKEAADATVEDIRAAGGKASAFQASVESFEEDQAMVEAIVDELGPIDLLVNNAGTATRGNTIVETDHRDIHRAVDVHFFGGFYLCQLVVPIMRHCARGDIIMISSIATEIYAANSGPYNVAKAAQEALAKTLAKEEATNGIRVNIVAPGLVDSEMGRRLVRANAGIELHELDETYPFGHVPRPEEIGDVVVFLASSSASQITGQRIAIDGGKTSY